MDAETPQQEEPAGLARSAWLAARQTGIGSTDAPAILGLTKWRSALQVYAEKTGALPLDSGEETDRQRWGHLLEPVIAAEYERETKRQTYDPGPYTIQRSIDHEWLISTVDRFITPQAPGAPPGVLEIKTADQFKADEWIDQPPLMYQVQLQHHLAVTGHQWGSLAVLIGGHKFVWKDLPRNDDFIEQLLAREAEFWERVQRREAPPPDASKACRETLHALYPRAEFDDLVKLDAEALAWDAEREAALRAIKVNEEVLYKIENRLKGRIGVHGGAVLPNGLRYLWRVEPRAGHTVKPSEPRVLRRKERV